MDMMGRCLKTLLCGPRGSLGGLGIRGLDSRPGTEMVYLTALQKQPPVRVNGVIGSVAMGMCFEFVGFEFGSTESTEFRLVVVGRKLLL